MKIVMSFTCENERYGPAHCHGPFLLFPMKASQGGKFDLDDLPRRPSTVCKSHGTVRERWSASQN